MSRLKKSRRLAWFIFFVVAVLIAVPAMSRSNSYLSSVGPPNLRFESSQTRGTLVPTVYFLSESKPVKTEIAEIPAAPAALSKTLRVPLEEADSIKIFPPATNDAGSTIIASSPDSIPSATTSIDGSPISDASEEISVVTPQMLLNYLKPAPVGTGNADQTAVIVPVKFGFVPPAPVTSQTNHSSQAIYTKE